MTTHKSEHVHAQRPNSSVPQNAGTARVNGEIGPKFLKQKTFFLNKKWQILIGCHASWVGAGGESGVAISEQPVPNSDVRRQ